MRRLQSIYFLLLLVSSLAEARVFSFKEKGVAPFFRGSIGQSKIDDNAYGESSGTATATPSLSGAIDWNFGGEFGLALGFSETFFVRLGLEMLSAKNGDVKGMNGSGTTEWFTLDSSVFVFNPNVSAEFIFGQVGNFRMFTLVGVGMANVTLENRYSMTSAGTTALGKSDFIEKAEVNTHSAQAAVGFEVLFTDIVTFMWDVGYRHLPVSKLKLKGDTNSIAQGNVEKGETLKNTDGTTRSLDLSGVYTSLGFRFYF